MMRYVAGRQTNRHFTAPPPIAEGTISTAAYEKPQGRVRQNGQGPDVQAGGAHTACLVITYMST